MLSTDATLSGGKILDDDIAYDNIADPSVPVPVDTTLSC